MDNEERIIPEYEEDRLITSEPDWSTRCIPSTSTAPYVYYFPPQASTSKSQNLNVSTDSSYYLPPKRVQKQRSPRTNNENTKFAGIDDKISFITSFPENMSVGEALMSCPNPYLDQLSHRRANNKKKLQEVEKPAPVVGQQKPEDAVFKRPFDPPVKRSRSDEPKNEMLEVLRHTLEERVYSDPPKSYFVLSDDELPHFSPHVQKKVSKMTCKKRKYENDPDWISDEKKFNATMCDDDAFFKTLQLDETEIESLQNMRIPVSRHLSRSHALCVAAEKALSVKKMRSVSILASGELFTIPKLLLDSEELMRTVLCEKGFISLSEQSRKHLLTYLPKCENKLEEKKAIRFAFSRDPGLRHKTPIGIIVEKLQQDVSDPNKIMTLHRRCLKVSYDHQYRLRILENAEKLVSRRLNAMSRIYKYKPKHMGFSREVLRKMKLIKDLRIRAMERARLLMRRKKKRAGLAGKSVVKIVDDEETEKAIEIPKELLRPTLKSTIYDKNDLDLHQPLKPTSVGEMIRKHKALKKTNPDSMHLQIEKKRLGKVLNRSGVLSQFRKINSQIKSVKKNLGIKQKTNVEPLDEFTDNYLTLQSRRKARMRMAKRKMRQQKLKTVQK